MEKTYTYKKQGNGSDSWVCTETEGGEIIDVYMVYERPLNWYQLKVDLFANCANLIPQANSNFLTVFLTYLQDGQDGLSNEKSFMIYFNLLGISLTDEDKFNLNKCLENNNFTIRF